MRIGKIISDLSMVAQQDFVVIKIILIIMRSNIIKYLIEGSTVVYGRYVI